MAKRKKRVVRKHKQGKATEQKDSRPTLSQLKVDKRISIASIPVIVDPNRPVAERVRPASFTYEIVNPNTNLTVVVHIPHELLSKISAARALLLFGFENPRLPESPGDTWPHQWTYLNETQLNKLDKSGLPVLKQNHILTESLQIGSFAEGLYFSRGIEAFFDSWIEIIWQEYVIEQELRRYQELHKHGQPVVTIDQPNEINLQNAETWIPLENCVVRIRSIWERLDKHIIPLYFTGNIADTTKKQYWRNLDTEARKLLNQDQLSLYELLLQCIDDMKKSALKGIRDALIHNLSHRPTGVVPPGSTSAPSLPRTVEDLYQLVKVERSRVREALILMAAVIRAKTPVNRQTAIDSA